MLVPLCGLLREIIACFFFDADDLMLRILEILVWMKMTLVVCGCYKGIMGLLNFINELHLIICCK